MAIPKPGKSLWQIFFTSCTCKKLVHGSAILVPDFFLGGEFCGGLGRDLTMLVPFTLTPNQRCSKFFSHKEGAQTNISLPSRIACGAVLGLSFQVLNYQLLWQFSEMEKAMIFCDKEYISCFFLSGSQVSMKLL